MTIQLSSKIDIILLFDISVQYTFNLIFRPPKHSLPGLDNKETISYFVCNF